MRTQGGTPVRALAVGAAAICAICWLVPWAELVTGQIMLGILAIPPVAVAGLLVLLVMSRAARLIAPSLSLRPPEMAVVYIMMVTATMVCSFGLMERLLPALVGVNYFANPGNRWEQLYFPSVPPWLVPWDPAVGPAQFVSSAFYEGLREGERIPWRAWIGPLAACLALYGFVVLAFLALATILRRQWSDNEKLSFPLVQLPVEMMRERTGQPFFRNPLMWVGFAIPAILFSVNGLHNLRPEVPEVTVYLDLSGRLPPPLSGLSTWLLSVSPGALGFFYLLPRELLLSFWFFHLLGKLEEAITLWLALPPIRGMHVGANGYVGYQTDGAFFVLVAFMLVMALPHVRLVLKRAISREGARGEGELMPYRAAVWLLLASLVAAAVWLHQAGLSVTFAVFSLLVYVFVEAVVMARATAEGGLPMTEGCFTPIDISSLVIAPRLLGPRNLTGVAFFDSFFTRDLRGGLLPTLLDGQKLGDLMGLSRRAVLVAFVAAVILTIPISAAIQMPLIYHRGALTLWSHFERQNALQFFEENSAHLQGEQVYTSGSLVCFIIGAAITAWLGAMRVRFAGWPFLPLGFALSTSWGVLTFWFPMLVAWVVKSLVVRYGGTRLYLRLRPMFLGMIFGEFTTAVCWTLAAIAWHIRAPWFPWT